MKIKVQGRSRPVTVYDSFITPEPSPEYKLANIYLYIWAGLDLLLLAAGIAFIALAFVMMNPNDLYQMVLRPADVLGCFILAGFFIVTFLISIPNLLATVSFGPTERLSGAPLYILNIMLVIDQLVIIATGAFIWYRTLRERNTFFLYWESANDGMRLMLEEKFQCCNYYDTCASASSGPTMPVCVDPITAYADGIMNPIFTSMFATSAIVILLFLCTGCIIVEIDVLERWRKIDLKRGKIGKGWQAV